MRLQLVRDAAPNIDEYLCTGGAYRNDIGE